MSRWKSFPSVFRRRMILTGMTGIGCGTVAAVVFCASKDRPLLYLGSVILLICICKVVSYWHCAVGGHYHMITGVCRVSKGYAPLRFQKILLTTSAGSEVTLLIDKKAGIKDGLTYRFYFQGKNPEQTGYTYLDSAFLSDSLIGIELAGPEALSS